MEPNPSKRTDTRVMSRPRLFKDTLLYGVTNIATKMIGALLLPILTRLLSPSEYGVIDLIALGGILGFELVVLGTDFTVALYYYDETIDRRRLAGTLIVLRSAIASFVALCLTLSAPYLAQWGFGSVTTQFIKIIRIAAFTLPASGILSLWIIWLRQAGRSGALLGLTLARVLATALTTILLVTAATDRLEAYFWAMFSVDLSLSILVTLACWTSLGRPDWAIVRPMISKGIAFLPRSMYSVVMALITRQILLHRGSLDLVGQYAAANKISYTIWIGISASSQAWLAYSLSIVTQPEAPKIYARYLNNYVSWMGLCVVGVALFAADLLRVLTTPTYVLAAPAVGWQALSLMAVGSLVIVSTGLNIIKDTAAIGRTTLITGVIGIGLAIVLIPWIGIVGAAFAATFTQGLAAFVLYSAAQQRYPLPFDSKSLLRWIALITCGVTIATLLPTSFSWTVLLIKFGCAGLYSAALVLWGNLSSVRALLYRLRFTKGNQQSS